MQKRESWVQLLVTANYAKSMGFLKIQNGVQYNSAKMLSKHTHSIFLSSYLKERKYLALKK